MLYSITATMGRILSFEPENGPEIGINRSRDGQLRLLLPLLHRLHIVPHVASDRLQDGAVVSGVDWETGGRGFETRVVDLLH